MEMTNLTRNIQTALPDKAILDAPTLKTGEEYWYISTNNLESCIIGYGKLTNQINRIKSLITTRSAYGSQFEKSLFLKAHLKGFMSILQAEYFLNSKL